MKGVVFDILRDMVEEQFGLEGWNALLEKAGSDGLYLSSESYPDAEMTKLVVVACEFTGMEQEALLRHFGKYMVKQFYDRFPSFFDNCTGLLEFLASVDRIVHVEVLKLYPDANLPRFNYDQRPGSILMEYHSKRRMCWLAEGLILGSAEHFKEPIRITHDVCMHKGDESCHIQVDLVESDDG
ncbi:heme NO-binding domain-containing protein [uncultured Thalassolituus sp.]|uniref:heme NO-binding domain-containing protein n=1 Tax=uncultured Thalassolituus sp. TaxID=285273 RepID=UPI00262F3167|nr:heme NO-binding domain-containing protein [uncultured Thalassolituus sp.]